MKNKLKKQLTNRLIVVFLLILIQLLIILYSIFDISGSYTINIFFRVFSYIIVIYIINRQDNPAYKIAWCILVLIVPLFGGVLYLLFGGRKVSKALRMANLNYEGIKDEIENTRGILQQLYSQDHEAYKLFNYGFNADGFSIYENTNVTFFASGEEKYASMLEELPKAKHFIFLEYFIIEEGKMWNKILEILEAKVKERVKVIVIYDDFGCATNLASNYDAILKSKGIKAILAKLNISPDEAMAFGDDTNDIPMFKLVKHSVCLGNGNPEAKKHASFVTDTIENDGMYKALKKYNLI